MASCSTSLSTETSPVRVLVQVVPHGLPCSALKLLGEETWQGPGEGQLSSFPENPELDHSQSLTVRPSTTGPVATDDVCGQ